MRKSTSAKKDNYSWINCSKCNRKIVKSSLKNHETDCNLEKISYIEDNKYFGQKSSFKINLPDIEKIAEISKDVLQPYLFIPDSLGQLLDLKMGCLVTLLVNDKIYVKKIWSVTDSNSDVVYSVAEDLLSEFEALSSPSKFIISKLPSSTSVNLSSEITLQAIDQVVNEIQEKELLIILKNQLKSSIVHRTSSIVLKFYNKTFKFSILSAAAKTSESLDLADIFKKISLDEFYRFDGNTTVRIKKEESEQEVKKVKNKFTLQQFGGYEDVIQELKNTMDVALGVVKSDEFFKITRGALIYGAPGTGKSMLCKSLANHYKTAHKITIDSWKIYSKFYGESENNLKKHFEDAFEKFPEPCILIIDELSNLSSKKSTNDSNKRVTTTLSNLMDTLYGTRKGSRIFVLANTSNLEDVDPVLRRSGRFDLEKEILIPNSEIREQILGKMLMEWNLKINLEEVQLLAKNTHGFVAADLKNLLSKSLVGDQHDFQSIFNNLKSVKPSAMREILIEKPNVKWEDIGGREDLKLKLRQIVEWPINHPETFKRLGIEAPRGLLMFGPPGNSKTMIAKALAAETNLNFISIKGSDLFSMWVGESEKAVSQLFMNARRLSPCILFFDEIDAIGGERSSDSGSSVKERVLAQILTEIDGVHTLKNVIILAATNRPDLIDSALLRPGRLDRIVYVELPDALTRKEIFRIKLAKIPAAENVEIDELVKSTEGYSGAEIDAVCKEAALKALMESFDTKHIEMRHFQEALCIIKPRTNKELLTIYEDYLNKGK